MENVAPVDGELPLPLGLVLAYPVVNTCPTVSPSRMVHMGDPLLRFNVLLALNEMYVGKHCCYTNMYLSPVLAPSKLLEQFPPTDIYTGEYDTFLDDAVDMHNRLSELNVPSSLNVLPGIPHGFLAVSKLWPEADKTVNDICARLRNLVTSAPA